MAKKYQLTGEEISRLSYLARLNISKSEEKKYKRQLEETLAYVSNLEEINTDNINPAGWRGELKNVYFSDGEKNERHLTKEEVFKNAKNKKNNYFVTGKTI